MTAFSFTPEETQQLADATGAYVELQMTATLAYSVMNRANNDYRTAQDRAEKAQQKVFDLVKAFGKARLG